MGANLVALYDYNMVVQSGTHDHQPLQRFIGHTDVVTAVAAAEGDYKECFLSGQLRPALVRGKRRGRSGDNICRVWTLVRSTAIRIIGAAF